MSYSDYNNPDDQVNLTPVFVCSAVSFVLIVFLAVCGSRIRRKRVQRLAQFHDTPPPYPGIEMEERGELVPPDYTRSDVMPPVTYASDRDRQEQRKSAKMHRSAAANAAAFGAALAASAAAIAGSAGAAAGAAGAAGACAGGGRGGGSC